MRLFRRGAAGLLALALVGCAETFDASSVGVPVTMASPAGQPAQGEKFSVTSHAVYGFWGMFRIKQPSLQRALSAQLGKFPQGFAYDGLQPIIRVGGAAPAIAGSHPAHPLPSLVSRRHWVGLPNVPRGPISVLEPYSTISAGPLALKPGPSAWRS